MINNKLNSIQMLRGIAALLVLFYHFGSNFTLHTSKVLMGGIFDFGYNGVDLFFVISGFIITYTFINEKVKTKISTYLLKRFIRIYPIYWLVTILLIPLYFIVTSIGVGYQREPLFIVKSFLLIPQVHFPLLSVGWTLTHELKFYVLFGLFIIPKNSLLKYIGGMWVFTTVLFSLHIINTSFFWIDFIFSSFNLEFLLGAFSAFIVLKKVSHLPFIIIGTIFYFGIGFLEGLGGLHIIGKYHILVYGISAAILVIGLATSDRISVKAPFLPLVILGDASYSIYLTHLPISNVLSRGLNPFQTSLQSYMFEFLIILITIIAGVGFYFKIEKPVIKHVRNIFLKRKDYKNEKTRVQVDFN